MGRTFLFLFISTLIPASVAGAGESDYFQQDVHYTLRVRLDAEAKRLTGNQTIVYTNNSPDSLNDVYLHLYPNAYRNRHTAFMRFFRRRFNINLFDVPRSKRGWIDLSNVAVDGAPVPAEIEDTVARIRLPRPLAPGRSVTLTLEFVEKIREQLGRAGYRGNHFDMAQWYPKVAVYDENGFHAKPWQTGEFYGEFGTFDVHITLPGNFVVAATGELVAGDPGWSLNRPGVKKKPREAGGEREVHFRAERVHDFAWCADPTFVVQDTTIDHVTIRSVYRRAHEPAWKDSTLAHGVRAYNWLKKTVGAYPYTQINIVDAALGGGMEYPMLVMDGRASEGLVVHEVGHIWFYGILANDEQAAAWLDEGFTTFQTRWYMESRYGEYGDRSRLNWYERITPRRKLWEDYRNSVFPLLRAGYGERAATPSPEFEHSYRANVYRKASLTLNALRGILGDDGMREAFHNYLERWQLKHVNEKRFRSSVEEVSGLDLKYQFEAWLHTRKQCDYRLAKVTTREKGDSTVVGITIEREGEVFLPFDLEFETRDGQRVVRRIDDRSRTIRREYVLASRPRRTTVGPGNSMMDVDFADNTLPRKKRFIFDWPRNDYYAEDAYTVRYRPTVWYNRVDETKVGAHFDGSFYNWARRVRLGIYYGVASERVDFSASYDKPMVFLGQRGRIGLSSYKLEGRRDTDVHLSIVNRARLSIPPTHRVRVGYNWHRLTDARYLTSTEIYDKDQTDVSIYASYSVTPQADFFSSSLTAGVRIGRTWTGGAYQYEKFQADFRAHSRREYVPVDIRVRGFVGLLGGSLPTQRKFSLAGAGPIATNSRFWLRAPDAVWKDLNFHEPGDGNVRGYRAGTFGVNRIAAFNAEMGTRIPMWKLGKLTRPLFGDVSWYGFYDVAKVLDDVNPIGSSTRVQALVDAGVLDAAIQDAGIGLRSRIRWPFWSFTARVDFPLWLNRPDIIGESDKTSFRYLVGISSTF